MNDQDIAQMASWMAAAGISQLHLQGPDLSLTLTGPAAKASRSQATTQLPAALAPVATEPSSLSVQKAPCAGHFLATHPMRSLPFVEMGSTVNVGDTLGLIQVGGLLVPVRSNKAGVIRQVSALAGELIGFGTPLFEIQPKE